VVNLRFAELPQNPIAEPTGVMSMFAFTKDDLMRGIELAVMAVLGIIVLLLVVRPLVRRIITSEPGANLPALAHPQAPESHTMMTMHTLATPSLPIAPHSPTAKMLDIAQVQGQVHAQSVQRVAELVDKNPNETVAVIRQWLGEPTAP
jgi:flagellar M-ring protein FliF